MVFSRPLELHQMVHSFLVMQTAANCPVVLARRLSPEPLRDRWYVGYPPPSSGYLPLNCRPTKVSSFIGEGGDTRPRQAHRFGTGSPDDVRGSMRTSIFDLDAV